MRFFVLLYFFVHKKWIGGGFGRSEFFFGFFQLVCKLDKWLIFLFLQDFT